MKLIGKGAFTKAWLTDSGKVFLKSNDPIKECMSLGWFPDADLFPTIKRLNIEEYEMDYYERPRSLKNNLTKKEWELYKALRKIAESICFISDDYRRLTELDRSFDFFLSEKFESEKEALKEALAACTNYGPDVCFEISPRNVAIKNRKLVLLDCFFIKSML